jgi:hypothetical protein
VCNIQISMEISVNQSTQPIINIEYKYYYYNIFWPNFAIFRCHVKMGKLDRLRGVLTDSHICAYLSPVSNLIKFH